MKPTKPIASGPPSPADAPQSLPAARVPVSVTCLGFGLVERATPALVYVGARTRHGWMKFECTTGGAENLYEQLGAALGYGLNAGERLRLAELENLLRAQPAANAARLDLAAQLAEARRQVAELRWQLESILSSVPPRRAPAGDGSELGVKNQGAEPSSHREATTASAGRREMLPGLAARTLRAKLKWRPVFEDWRDSGLSVYRFELRRAHSPGTLATLFRKYWPQEYAAGREHRRLEKNAHP